MSLTRLASSSFAVLAALLSATSLHADVKLPSIFADHMVLQRELPIPVWGWAAPDTKVVVELGDAKVESQVGAAKEGETEARWNVALPPQAAGGPHVLKVVVGDQSREIQDVYVGEVWICSGQSNMEWGVGGSENGQAVAAEANDPLIRHYRVPHVVADSPQSDVHGDWTVGGPGTVAGWTAVGYFFGKQLREELDVPVGLVHTSWGGTRAEAWTRRSTLDKEPEFVPLLKWWDDRVDRYDPAAEQARYDQRLAEWEVAAAKAREAGQPEPAKPPGVYDPSRDQHRPAALYNSMIAPLVPFAVRGAIWYQGESNVDRAVQYRKIFPAMIASWREDWGRDFPFYFVQLAPYRYGNRDPQALAELWEAQSLTSATVPNTGMAVITDIGDIKDIHPRNKAEVGRRLALWALAKDYGKSVEYSGPVFHDATPEGGALRLAFTHVANGLKSLDGEPLSNFEVAGEDGQFKPAGATTDGKMVVVSSPDVPAPKYVRFGWTDTAEPNLVNSVDLPASPFRTDDLPAKTADVQIPQ